jgi:hypothetical protein
LFLCRVIKMGCISFFFSLLGYVILSYIDRPCCLRIVEWSTLFFFNEVQSRGGGPFSSIRGRSGWRSFYRSTLDNAL